MFYRSALAPMLLVCASGWAAEPSTASQPGAWSDTYTTRLEALALLQSLNVELLSRDSATLTLDRWCGTHRLAAPARVVAERVRGQDKPPTAEQRQILGVGADEPVRYRRVRLRCGGHVLSEADNWYVPARLTPEMNRALETSDVAFGRAVQDLHFRRRTLAAALLWSPLPEGWERTSSSPQSPPAPQPADREAPNGRQPHAMTSVLHIPDEVLQHRAVLTLPDGTPFSTLIETYTSEVLGFPEPPGE